MWRRRLRVTGWAIFILLAVAGTTPAEDFEAMLGRVDVALKTNPSRVPTLALESCLHRRDQAVALYRAGQNTRAERSLRFCFDVLDVPPTAPVKAAPKPVGPTMEEIAQRAAAEIERALTLTPDLAHGLEIYRSCAMCHMPEGFGLHNGSVPQIAGQHRSVVIKQLADIRAGKRDARLMIPYATVESIGGPQGVADVAGYIDTLEISVAGGKGPGTALDLGKRVYAENCARCHGPQGEGNDAKAAPRIQAQHYRYLKRQFEWIRTGQRRNADPEMTRQIETLGEQDIDAVLDYVSRLEPPVELQAPPGWRNPDFPEKRRAP